MTVDEATANWLLTQWTITASEHRVDVEGAGISGGMSVDGPIRASLDGDVSLLSSARVRAVIGYAPAFGWRSAKA